MSTLSLSDLGVMAQPLLPRDFQRRHAGTVLAAVGILLAGLVAVTHRTDPQPSGLIGTLGLGWVAAVVVIATGGLVTYRLGGSLAGPVLMLCTVVVFSQVLTYGEPTVMAASRHVGVIDFIRVTGGLQPELDIYQSWAGLFAGLAWVCDVAGIANPLALATWWPVLLSPATVLAVAVLARPLIADTNRRWIAAGVFGLANTLNIVYASPQSVGLLFGITIFALALVPPRPVRADDAMAGSGRGQRLRKRALALRPARLLGILVLSVAMAVTHQISPYLTVAALFVLVVFRLVRPWWLPFVVLAPAVAWAVVNAGQLTGFVEPGDIGRIFENVRPPNHSAATAPRALVTTLAFGLPAVVLVVLAGLTFVNALIERNRTSWALVFAAISPASLFVASDYGQEGVFRVALFALPWMAIGATRFRLPRRVSAAFIAGLSVVILFAVNAFGQTALDWNRVMTRDAAEAIVAYENSAPTGAVLMSMGTENVIPQKQTSRYVDVGYMSREALGPYPSPTAPYNADADVAGLTLQLTKTVSATAYYAMVSDTVGAYGDRYGFQSWANWQELEQAMATSSRWERVFTGPTATLYRLKTPASANTQQRGG